MFLSTRRSAAVAALALGMTAASAMLVQPADAAMRHRHHHSRHMAHRLRPAHQNPAYVGAPGYAGGQAYAAAPGYPGAPGYGAPGGNPGLLGQGGFLGVGILPQTQLFNGVPVLGQFGF